MEENKLYYGYMQDSPRLSVPCPYVTIMKIGSVGCQGCYYFKRVNIDEYYVTCTYDKDYK